MVENTHIDTVDPADTVDRSITGIVPRGMAAGLLAGMITGTAAGTALVPLAGSVIGLFWGTVVGLLLGSVDSLALVLVSRLLETRAQAATASAAVAGVSGAVLMAFVDLGDDVEVAFVGVCAVIGALVGPRVVMGKRPAVTVVAEGLASTSTTDAG